MSWCAVFPDCDVPQGMGVSPPVGQVRTHCALRWRYNGAVLCAFGDCRLLIHGGLLRLLCNSATTTLGGFSDVRPAAVRLPTQPMGQTRDRKSTRLNSSQHSIS